MNVLTIIILLLLFIINYCLQRSIIAPTVVTNAVWLMLLLIYNTADHGLYALSDRFYIIVIIWNLGFSLAALLTSKFKIIVPSSMNRENPEKLGNSLLWIMCVCLIVSICGLYYIGHSLNSENVFAGVRQNSVSILNGEKPLDIPVYFRIANVVVAYAIVVVGSLLLIRGDKRKIVIFCCILVSIYTLFRSSKSTVVQLMFFFLTLYIIRKGISRKLIIRFFGAFVLMMLLAHLLRAGEEKATNYDFAHMLAVYLLSPLPAFDYVSSNQINLIQDFHGEYTFRALIPYLNLFGYNLTGNSDPFNLHFWTFTPLPVNVYTIFFSFFVDFGYPGIIASSLFYGFFFTFLWKGCKKKIPMYQVAYSSCFYILAFQFFTDYLFQFFWTNVLTLVFTIIFFTHVCVRKDSFIKYDFSTR